MNILAQLFASPWLGAGGVAFCFIAGNLLLGLFKDRLPRDGARFQSAGACGRQSLIAPVVTGPAPSAQARDRIARCLALLRCPNHASRSESPLAFFDRCA